jgi:Fic family protein
MRLMTEKSSRYIWQRANWPEFKFDLAAVSSAISQARRFQGEIEGKALAIGIDRADEVTRDVLAQEVLATAAIEGEKLDPLAVRSSVMRRLGLADTGPHDRQVDGLVEVINDAAVSFQESLDHDRLFRWQAALFPGGTSGIRRIAVGRYRDHEDPIQIVSGVLGKEIIHYEAPPSTNVPAEMDRFLQWFATTKPTSEHQPPIDGFARAAIAHVWFETIHPFEDGNGRIGRAIVDMAIAQDQGRPLRLYSLSRQLLESRTGYYDALNRAQHGSGDMTDWIQWFAGQITAACNRSSSVIDQAIGKSRFWADHSGKETSARQRKVLQRLLDDGDGGFAGGLNAEKYMKMTGASKATATRDLAALLASDMLRSTGRGKSVRYFVNVPGWSHGTHGDQESSSAIEPPNNLP